MLTNAKLQGLEDSRSGVAEDLQQVDYGCDLGALALEPSSPCNFGVPADSGFGVTEDLQQIDFGCDLGRYCSLRPSGACNPGVRTDRQ